MILHWLLLSTRWKGGGRYEVMMGVDVSVQSDRDVPASSNSDGEVVLSAS